MKWLFQRLSEASTWAGFAALIPSVIGLVADRNNPAAWGAAATGVAAVLVKEKGHPDA